MTVDWPMAAPRVSELELKGVGRAFGRIDAVWDVSLTFRAGEICALLGPNGAGKSTLLQLIATLDRPTEGVIVFDERVDAVAHRDTVRPHLGLVAHDSLLYGELTGRENLRFVCDLQGLAHSAAEQWVTRVGLDAAADRPVSTYSRGMKQRLSIARALLTDPSVLLFDEPLTGLDASARGFLFELMQWLREQRRIVIVVTHHLSWPSDAVDRAVVLDGGRVRADVRLDGESLVSVYEKACGRAAGALA
ncbi:MAG: heme exporter protein A [Bradymonadia bacterium]|jgi:heme exporter protein A